MRFLAVAVALVVFAHGGEAFAHDVRGEVVFLDVGDRTVDVEVDIPIPQLALARQEDVDAVLAEPTEHLAADARAFVALRDRSGAPFALSVLSIMPAQVGGGSVMAFQLRFRPPPGETARWFELADELVLHTVITDNIYVFLRRDLQAGALGDAPTLVGSMHYQQRSLVVDRTSGNWLSSLTAAFHLGVDHIREGTDHLMFLLMLLVVAPLARAGRTWSSAAPARRGLARTVGIATAFTLGHSATLALGAVGGVTLPLRFVESAIAVSILVSAIHAWRPLFAGREPLVAAGFGLVHGLAFATALAGLGFDGRTLALALLGFNLGVEAMQLAVVAVTVPSLMVLARRPVYAVLRRAAAALATVASVTWLVERTLGITTPLSSVFDRIARHGIWVAIGLAGMVLASLVAPHRRMKEVIT